MQLHKAIKEIEDGLLSIAEASRNYDISMEGIYNWLWSFGKDETLMKFSLLSKYQGFCNTIENIFEIADQQCL